MSFAFGWHSNTETQRVSESSSLCLHTPASLVLWTLNRIVWKCFFRPSPLLLLTHDWQTKIIKNNKRPGGLGPAELAPLLSVVAQALALGQLIFIGKARSTEGLEGLYITGCVILTDKPSLTLLLTETLNYCLCLLFKTTFFAVLFPLDNSIRDKCWRDRIFPLDRSPIGW